MSEPFAEYDIDSDETRPEDIDPEAEVDELPEEPRGAPLEADPADAADQYRVVELDDDYV